MSYTVVPDVTASDPHYLEQRQTTWPLPSLWRATLSESLSIRRNDGLQPLRPAFCGSAMANRSRMPTKWNSLTTTGGVGWIFAELGSLWRQTWCCADRHRDARHSGQRCAWQLGN